MTASSTARLILLQSGVGSSAPTTEIGPRDETDEELICRICLGDMEALRIMFRRYARMVRAVSVRILRDTGEADDLVQEVFLYLYDKCRTFDSTKASGRSWIIQITYSRAIDRRRYLATRYFYDHLNVDDPGLKIASERTPSLYDESIEAVVGTKEARVLFDCLSDDQRETFRLFFFEGYTFEEIANLLGQTLGNIRNHYYRGLEKIRERVFPNKKRDK